MEDLALSSALRADARTVRNPRKSIAAMLVVEMATGEAEQESGMLPFVDPRSGAALQHDGSFLVSNDGKAFPIVNGIPRFVESDDYAAAFGLQWVIHSCTQLDSETGAGLSRIRLERCLGAPLSSLQGKTVLEAGCGAGRFTELLVNEGARVHAIDLSRAVDANKENIGEPANYLIAQADLTELPFPAEAFDVVVCLGVLQHTPSPESSMRALWAKLKPGGLFVIDHYTWDLSLVTKLAPVYRQILKRLPPPTAKRLTDTLVEMFFPLHWAVRDVFPLQALLSRVSPCQVYFRSSPELTREQHFELSRLDTFDQLTDHYKWLRTPAQIRRTLSALGGEEVTVRRGGNGVEARCRKPVGQQS
jgi:2-polyprenyl-3-methyl-5-hydroxy-6-metoxy-1,4-benzoquinol methylase